MCKRYRLLIGLSIIFLASCGGGSNSGSSGDTENSEWDSITWNQDNWQ